MRIQASRLEAGRTELLRSRLDAIRRIVAAGIALPPITITADHVIWDGNHRARVAAERGEMIEATITDLALPSQGAIVSIPVYDDVQPNP